MNKTIKLVLINCTKNTKIMILDVYLLSVSYPMNLTIKIMTYLRTKFKKTIV